MHKIAKQYVRYKITFVFGMNQTLYWYAILSHVIYSEYVCMNVFVVSWLIEINNATNSLDKIKKKYIFYKIDVKYMKLIRIIIEASGFI